MELKDMSIEELMERRAAIVEEVEAPEADLDALEAEARAIKEELETRKAEEAKRAEIRSAVAAGQGEVTKTIKTEERKVMSNMEIRNSAEYINAYAEYIKSENDAECRALLTENVSGTVPVPEFVYDIVKTAWERDGITSRVRKSYLRGNLKVGFEISGDDAVVHTEGAEAIDPENLVLGVVNLVPVSIKKVVQISDEVYDLRGESFLRYIYDELTYRIAKKAADTLIDKILACGTVSTTTCPGVPEVSASLALGTVAEAVAQLSDAAANPVIIMNKASWGSLKGVQYAASYAADPTEGLPVVFSSKLTAYSAATTGVPYMIVGDLDQGALMNFPGGSDAIEFKFDNISLKKQDLIEVLGRQYVGIGVVAPNAFVKVVK